jgi:alkylhydroperoxidase family enzyme
MDVPAVLATHLADHPDVLEQLGLAHDAAWKSVDTRLLQLCQQRIRELLGSADQLTVHDWYSSPHYTDTEKACLAFTEQYIVDVANLDDTTVRTVGSHLGDQGLADFVSALLVVEQRERIALAWTHLFGESA